MSPRTALLATLALLGGAVTACGTIIGVDERHAGAADAAAPADGTDAEPRTSADDGDGGARDAEASAPLKAQTLGQFVDPVLAMGESELLVTDRTGSRSTIVLISKSDPTHPKTIYDQPSATASTRVSTIGLARGQVWYTTSDGKLHRMTLAGLNPTVVDTSSSSILARSANTLWTASPDDLTNAPTLRWIGADLLSQVPEATLAFGGPVLFAFGSDDELAFCSRTPSGQWTLGKWRPFAGTPLTTLATFAAYPSWVAADPQRMLVYAQDEGTVVSWSRITPQTTPTTVLVDVPAPVSIKSDGTNLVLRSQTTISSCTIASCAASLHALSVPTTFAKARYLELDAQYAYFFHAKSDADPMTLVRVPR